ncbi:MAG: HAMP domain-containing sensor histidine kinase [Myxococcota bacterium]|nr:HAMP domain-containing sensor histidine kinase [Myxococcota bacterium]
MSSQEQILETNLANSQKQVEQLSQEVLELYRQVNLLYRLGDVFSAGLQTEDVCGVLMIESTKVVRARSAFVRLSDGRTFGRLSTNPASKLSVGIETPMGRMGEITLFDKKRGFFTAADEKLIRAVARQAGVALENSRRIEGLIEQNEALETLNDELRALDQMKSDFVGNVSHELRTPLASIKGFAATMLADQDMPREVANEFVGIINDESDKLIAIINDLLDVSKMMSGHMDYRLAKQSLTEILQQVTALLKIQARGKNVDLDLDIQSDMDVRIDPTRMHQVFINLVGNAIKFTDAGSVKITQWTDDDGLHVSIADTGIGIPADLLPNIFDKFYRVENIVHTKEGTGLGLALVRGIVDYHGGTVDVESIHGEGTTFTVHLPPPRAIDHDSSIDVDSKTARPE